MDCMAPAAIIAYFDIFRYHKAATKHRCRAVLFTQLWFYASQTVL